MGIVGLLVRAELRRRWRTVLILGLLVGVVAGASMWGVAAARRTGSSYARLLDATNAEDVLVNPDDGYADPAYLIDQPQVVDHCTAAGAPIYIADEQGQPVFAEALTLASDGKCFYEVSRPARIDGRLPDPDEPYEIFLSSSAADNLGLGTGDRTDVLFATSEDAEPELLQDLLVTGTGVFGQDAFRTVGDDLSFPVIAMTPAFREQHPWPSDITFTGSLVTLEHGKDDIAPYIASVLEDAGEVVLFEDRYENERKASQALEPYVLALWLFAAGVAVAGGAMVMSALHRSLRDSRTDEGLLGALGVRRSHVAALPAALAAITGAVATSVAAIGSVALSGMAPIGPARPIDPDPGLQVDMAVIGVGVALTLLAVAVVFGLAMIGQPASVTASRGMRERIGALSRLRLGLPVPAATGVRMSTGELGRSRTGARTTLIGAIAGVIAVFVVELVGAGLVRLIDEPPRYGWTWDARVNIDSDFGDETVFEDGLASVDAITDRTPLLMGQLDVGGITVAAVGVGESKGGVVLPPLLEGRYAENSGEVVLGATTLRRLGADVGDAVPVRSGQARESLEVVGTATFPLLAEYPGAPHTGLGEGAMVTADQFTALTGTEDFAAWLVRLEAGTDPSEILSALPDLEAEEAEFILVENPQRPEALFGYEDTSGLRHLLAALLGAIAVVSVTLGITSSVRGARRDLAVLRTVGMTKRQVRSAVHTHGAVVAGLALVIGLPLGVAAGRWAWEWFADHLGVADDPINPAITIGGLVVVSLVSAVVISLPVARGATRHNPATVLRSE